MNRDRIVAELPPDMATWLDAHASDDTWEQLARDLAVSLGVQLLGTIDTRGEAGINPLLHAVHLTAASPTLRHVAAKLDCGGRRWTIERVAKAVTKYLELEAGRYNVHRRLQERFAPQRHEADAA